MFSTYVCQTTVFVTLFLKLHFFKIGKVGTTENIFNIVNLRSFFLTLLLPLVKAPFWKILQFFHSLSLTYVTLVPLYSVQWAVVLSINVHIFYQGRGAPVLCRNDIVSSFLFKIKYRVGTVQVMQYGRRQKYCKKPFSKFWIKLFFSALIHKNELWLNHKCSRFWQGNVFKMHLFHTFLLRIFFEEKKGKINYMYLFALFFKGSCFIVFN